jgi:hypothetical protein
MLSPTLNDRPGDETTVTPLDDLADERWREVLDEIVHNDLAVASRLKC